MIARQLYQSNPLPKITWEKLPNDFILPDEPVESNLQPLLASALGESLELAGLILESMLITSNFGLCATVGDKTVVKAPDWVYVPSVQLIPAGEIRRSYTPHTEGDIPTIVLEFISETEGGEYSINLYFCNIFLIASALCKLIQRKFLIVMNYFQPFSKTSAVVS